ncbi:MAG: hypothetical protein H0X66_15255 [Verrucomicrobia bacterium]|nr:hypothetical protein [Verrucomicrobiota bacterium]
MTGLEIVQFLWAAGKTAYEIATGIKNKKEEDRRKVAELFQHIGQLLHETYLELDKGNYPYGHCRQIAIFGEQIKSKCKKLLGEEEAEKLGNLLISAHEVERLHGELNSGTINKWELAKLQEASGEFIAASKLLIF